MTAYYNEIDPKAAAWLRELIAQGHIPAGDVDERSIEDVTPVEISGYTQCHFFAGIGGWALALKRAGWPEDKPVWTGSCPCQPFSAAGKGVGFADERHLWPAWHHLISQCRPSVVFGEQVASKDGLGWLDLVQADMEGSRYAIAANDICAAGVGAPHIRQRLWFVAERLDDAAGARHVGQVEKSESDPRHEARMRVPSERRGPSGVADADSKNQSGRGVQRPGQSAGACEGSALKRPEGLCSDSNPSPTNGLWGEADWVFCRDGKWRPVEASSQPLADGVSESLGRVRNSCIEEIEEEIDAWSLESQIDRAEGLRALQEALAAQARSVWEAGRIPGLCEAPFLLAFMRQLATQGWQIKEGVALSCTETAGERLRMLRDDETAASASCERGLAEQQPGEPSNALHLLSSILARHTQEAWTSAYSAYAEIGFPIGHGSEARVARLRGYGNAINVEVAKTFIESYCESCFEKEEKGARPRG